MPRNKRYLYTVRVEGNLPFPIDMLRYDRCTPKSESDSSFILESLDPMAGRVKLEVVHTDGSGWSPTDGRWQSFGWEILGVRQEAIP